MAKNVWNEVLDDMRAFTRDLDALPDDELKAKYRHRTVKGDLTPAAYTADTVKAIRIGLQCSQSVFAKFVGVSLGTVRNWEQGVVDPTGAACRLFDEIRFNPAYWRLRLKQITASQKTPATSPAQTKATVPTGRRGVKVVAKRTTGKQRVKQSSKRSTT